MAAARKLKTWSEIKAERLSPERIAASRARAEAEIARDLTAGGGDGSVGGMKSSPMVTDLLKEYEGGAGELRGESARESDALDPEARRAMSAVQVSKEDIERFRANLALGGVPRPESAALARFHVLREVLVEPPKMLASWERHRLEKVNVAQLSGHSLPASPSILRSETWRAAFEVPNGRRYLVGTVEVLQPENQEALGFVQWTGDVSIGNMKQELRWIHTWAFTWAFAHEAVVVRVHPSWMDLLPGLVIVWGWDLEELEHAEK